MIADKEKDKKGNIIEVDGFEETFPTMDDLENHIGDIQEMQKKAVKKKSKAKGIKEGVNVDYHTIMDKANFVYADWYEKMMFEKSNSFYLGEEIVEKLSKKRKFGIEKYGDKSFQNSFDASITSPAKEHAFEELIDELNYLLHLHFVALTNGTDKSLNDVDRIEQAIDNVKNVFNILEELDTL